MATEANQTTDTHPAAESIADALGAAWDSAEVGSVGEDIEEALEETDQAEETETEELEAADESEDEEEESEVPEAPEHWSDDDKAIFNELPDDAKQWWLDKTKELEKGYQEKFEETAEARKFQESIDELFSPFKAQMDAQGKSEVDVISDLVAIGTAFETKPLEAIQWVVGNYGRSSAGTDQARDLVRKIADGLGVNDVIGQGGEAAAGETDAKSPEARRIAALEQELRQLKGTTEQQQRSAEQQQRQQVERAISDFKEAKDESGNLKHPHFDKVKEVMGALITSGKADSMDKAYDMAVHADPELREAVSKKQAASKVKGTGEKRRAATSKAKKASTPKSKTNGATSPSSKASIADELEAQWDAQIAGRV